MKIVVFGNRRFASLVWTVLSQDSAHEVVGFTVDRDYLGTAAYHGLPVVPFEDLEEHFPAPDHGMLVGLGYKARNGLRAERFGAAVARGYRCVSYLSSRASRWPDLTVGANCMIFEGAVIEPFCGIADNVVVRSRAYISHHCRIADHAFIAPGAILAGGVTVAERAFIGAGAVIRDGVTVAPRSFIAAGAVLHEDTRPDGVYIGNPARLVKRN